MKKRKVIICVDDEQFVLNAVAKQLQRAVGADYEYELAESAEEAREIMEDVFRDGDELVMVISDQIMPSIKGDEFLVKVHQKHPQIIKILLTGQAALESAVNAVNNADLFRYLTKPWEEQDFILTVKKGLERYEMLKKLQEQIASFQRFVPKQFLESLSLKNYESVAPKQAKELTFSVLFTDVRGFTTISETLGAEKTFAFLNELFDCFGDAITANNGFIDKYIGDAIMAIFNGPRLNAVKASISMLEGLHALNMEKKDEAIFPVRIGIGINSGKAILGVVGSESRLDTTVIGDVVNTSARLEGLTKQLGVTLIVPKTFYNEVKKDSAIKDSGRLVYKSKIRGKEEIIDLYEIFVSDVEEVRAVKEKTKKDFEQAVELLAKGSVDKSIPLFEKCLKVGKGLDPTVHYYLDVVKSGEDQGTANKVAKANFIELYKKGSVTSAAPTKEKAKPTSGTAKKAAPAKKPAKATPKAKAKKPAKKK